MRSSAWVRWAATVGTVSLLAAGCSAGEDDGSAAPRQVTIASLMGAPDYSTIDYDAQQQKIEELVAECMIAEGWEYIPVKYPSSDGVVGYTDEDEVARISREGLGITYYLLNDPSTDVPVDDPWTGFVNPNDAYVASLTEAEQTAYYTSLNGTGGSPILYQDGLARDEAATDSAAKVVVNDGDGGCQGEAYKAVAGDDITASPDYQEAIQVYYDELQQRVDADPRTIELKADWSTCMKDAGYDYEDPQSYYDGIYTELQGRVDAVLGPDFYKDPMEGWTQQQIDDFYATATPEEIDELFSASRKLSADQRTQLEEILADEVSVALAEHSCSKVLNDGSQKVYTDVEDRYALEHADELKALAASLSSKG
ncbi:MAG: hypothetical protein HGA51_02375 [Demequinaceae bacterium]|nr:hypothetical protein [Demequinaceae bacterium]